MCVCVVAGWRGMGGGNSLPSGRLNADDVVRRGIGPPRYPRRYGLGMGVTVEEASWLSWRLQAGATAPSCCMHALRLAAQHMRPAHLPAACMRACSVQLPECGCPARRVHACTCGQPTYLQVPEHPRLPGPRGRLPAHAAVHHHLPALQGRNGIRGQPASRGKHPQQGS